MDIKRKYNKPAIRDDESQLKLISELFQPIANKDNKHTEASYVPDLPVYDWQQSYADVGMAVSMHRDYREMASVNLSTTPKGFKKLKTYHQDFSESVRPTKQHGPDMFGEVKISKGGMMEMDPADEVLIEYRDDHSQAEINKIKIK